MAIDWVGVDWGTSNLRAWVVDRRGDVIARPVSQQGMGTLSREAFAPALVELLDPWLAADRVTPVLCCGMVGSRQGWVEAGYVATPCVPPGVDQAVAAPLDDPRLAVWILPGVKQLEPADVMRGEETQLAGFLSQYPDFDGAVCLPGTHTKWVDLAGGRIRGFRTVMTGELFALLSTRSILRFAVDGEELDDAAFDAAVSDSLALGQGAIARLFSLRAQSLLEGTPAAIARGRLSGSLVGEELASTRSVWQGRPVAMIGAQRLAELYRRALSGQSVEVLPTDADRMTLAGLAAARQQLAEVKT